MGRFNKDAAIIAQNSASVAAQLTAAIIVANPDHPTSKESACELFDHVRTHVFNGSLALAGAEAIVEGMESARPATGLGRPSGGNPGDLAFRSGKVAGKTIAEVFAEDPSYITDFVATTKYKNEYMRRQAQAFLESVG